MSEKIYEPIEPPTAPFLSDPRAVLTDEERTMYNEVLEHFSKHDYAIPGLEKGELTETERFFISYECILRYLRATKWTSSEPAIQRLEATLKWRREYGLYDIVNYDLVEPEAVTGKEVLFGYDVDCRPGVYMFPSRQNTDEPTRQIQFAVWLLEVGLYLMPPGVETVTLLVNYGEKAKNPSLSVARAYLNILQDHYPERLGRAFILNVPFFVNAFYKLITPFIDPVIRTKMRFNPRVTEENLFSPDMVMKEWWGGDCDFEYVHEKYWPALVEMCESRRKTWIEKWRAMGGTVGLKEWDYKGGMNSEKIDVEQDVTLEKCVENGEALVSEPKDIEST